jgi:hypothetical protein
MELWQLDVVHGFLLADGTSAKALTGVDDHSRYCVSARLMARERTQSVCDGFSSALNTYGLPAQDRELQWVGPSAGGGLAGPVRADDAEDLTLVDREGHVLDRDVPSVPLV